MDQEFKEQVNLFMIWLGVAGTAVVLLVFVFYFILKYKVNQRRKLEAQQEEQK